MNNKTEAIYTITLQSNSRFGTNQTFYFNTESAANQKYAELKVWYSNVPTQNIIKSSHKINLQ